MNQNLIKKYSSLRYKKYRKKYRLFLAEGYHLVEELLKSDWKIESVLTSNIQRYKELEGLKKIGSLELVNPSVINKIADTSTPQDILAVVEIPSPPDSGYDIEGHVVIADRIKDPGNLGTIIRTARAFGFDAVVSTSTSADIFNPKTVRATQGAMFRIKILYSLKVALLENFLKPTHTFYALDPGGDKDVDNIQPADRSALIIGSEIEGIDDSLLALADYRIKIPQSDTVDSLNAAVAGGIAMHRFRQKGI
jgi:TrmH family RNA methyltransferase